MEELQLAREEAYGDRQSCLSGLEPSSYPTGSEAAKVNGVRGCRLPATNPDNLSASLAVVIRPISFVIDGGHTRVRKSPRPREGIGGRDHDEDVVRGKFVRQVLTSSRGAVHSRL